MFKLNTELMDLAEIVTLYQDGSVSLNELNSYALNRLQDAMDGLALLNFIDISEVEIGEGLLTEAQFKERLNQQPFFRRLQIHQRQITSMLQFDWHVTSTAKDAFHRSP